MISDFIDDNPAMISEMYYSEELEKEFIDNFKSGNYKQSKRILDRDKRILGRLNFSGLILLVFSRKLSLEFLDLLFKLEKEKFFSVVKEDPKEFIRKFYVCYGNQHLDQLIVYTSQISLNKCFLEELNSETIEPEGIIELYEKLVDNNFSEEVKIKIQILKIRNRYSMKLKQKEVEFTNKLSIKNGIIKTLKDALTENNFLLEGKDETIKMLKSSLNEKEKEIYRLLEIVKNLRKEIDHNSDNSIFKGSKIVNFDSKITYVNCFGKDVPQNIDSFFNFDCVIRVIPIKIQENIRKIGITAISPVQSHTIPVIMSGRDVMFSSPVDSGKTFAFLVPIVSMIVKSGRKVKKTNSPIALIIAPSEILCSQIFKEALKITYHTDVKCFVANGWIDKNDVKGVDILVSTPEKLLTLCQARIFNLSNIKFFVLDEANTLLDMNNMPKIENILMYYKVPKRQTIMSSVYMPRLLRIAAREFLKDDFVFISLGRIGYLLKVRKLEFQFVSFFYEKYNVLKKILFNCSKFNNNTKIVVFSKSFNIIQTLIKYTFSIRYLNCGIVDCNVRILEQEKAIELFKKKDQTIQVLKILFCTSMITNGVDLGKVDVCINFDFPRNFYEYFRQSEKAEKSISFVCYNEKKILENILSKLCFDSEKKGVISCTNAPKSIKEFLESESEKYEVSYNDS